MCARSWAWPAVCRPGECQDHLGGRRGGGGPGALFAGADAVVHLAWLIQPSDDQDTVWRANVEGSARVFDAVASAGVPTLAYASSVGAYSPGPKDRRVDEGWPTEGSQLHYSRQKAEVERRLDRFETATPVCRVVRLRPGLIFKRDAATEIRRYFTGPFLPNLLLRRRLSRSCRAWRLGVPGRALARRGRGVPPGGDRRVRPRRLQPGRRAGPGLGAAGLGPGCPVGECAAQGGARRREGHVEAASSPRPPAGWTWRCRRR